VCLNLTNLGRGATKFEVYSIFALAKEAMRTSIPIWTTVLRVSQLILVCLEISVEAYCLQNGWIIEVSIGNEVGLANKSSKATRVFSSFG